MTAPATHHDVPASLRLTWLDKTAIVTLVVALGLAFLTPPEATQGNVARLFYLHLPTILVAYAAFATTLIGVVAYLATKDLKWDQLAGAAAEVGVVFTGFTIIVGMIWAKPTWGVYWTWSARLTLTAVMFFAYLGYLALRRAVDDPVVRAKRSSLLGILLIGLIPIVHFSVIWWRDIHQGGTILRPDEMQIDGILATALLAGFVAWSFTGAALIRRSWKLARLEGELDQRLRAGDGRVAGDAVDTPALDGSKDASS